MPPAYPGAPLPPPGGVRPGDQRYIGRIKSFNAKNGFGFIDCPPAHDRWGRDVFIHKNWMGDLKVGTDISFHVEHNKEGMPQARDVIDHLSGRPARDAPPPLALENGGQRDARGKKRGGGIWDGGQRKGDGPGSTPSGGGEKPPAITGPRTTLMVKNLPAEFTRGRLRELLDSVGLEGRYDFVYVPVKFRAGTPAGTPPVAPPQPAAGDEASAAKAAFGYAFTNLCTPEDADKAMEKLQGHVISEGEKPLEVVWSEPHQGLQAHVERYRNSPVMHELVPDEHKPMLLNAGVPVPFPPPTKRLRPPRVRRSGADGKGRGKAATVADGSAADGAAGAGGGGSSSSVAPAAPEDGAGAAQCENGDGDGHSPADYGLEGDDVSDDPPCAAESAPESAAEASAAAAAPPAADRPAAAGGPQGPSEGPDSSPLAAAPAPPVMA